MTGAPLVQYADLVRSRKECRRCSELKNPASPELAIHDTEHIGPWSAWHGKFEPQVMIIGQEWGDVRRYNEQRGMVKEGTPTNKALCHLVNFAGVQMDQVFLTNAVLCLKEVGMQSRVSSGWFRNCEDFLKKTIEIVKPKVLVTLGERAYRSIERIYKLSPARPFRKLVDGSEGLILPSAMLLFPMFHCGIHVQNTHRPLARQEVDWTRIAIALSK